MCTLVCRLQRLGALPMHRDSSSDPHTANAALLLWDAAHHHGHGPAVVERGSTVTYAALRDQAAAFGAALRAAGVAPGDRVAIWLERGRGAAAAFFGALAAGAVAVIVNETLRPRQVEHILRHSGAR